MSNSLLLNRNSTQKHLFYQLSSVLIARNSVFYKTSSLWRSKMGSRFRLRKALCTEIGPNVASRLRKTTNFIVRLGLAKMTEEILIGAFPKNGSMRRRNKSKNTCLRCFRVQNVFRAMPCRSKSMSFTSFRFSEHQKQCILQAIRFSDAQIQCILQASSAGVRNRKPNTYQTSRDMSFSVDLHGFPAKRHSMHKTTKNL